MTEEEARILENQSINNNLKIRALNEKLKKLDASLEGASQEMREAAYESVQAELMELVRECLYLAIPIMDEMPEESRELARTIMAEYPLLSIEDSGDLS